MKKNIQILVLLLLTAMAVEAQPGYYTRSFSDKKLESKAKQWMKKGEWASGFLLPEPHSSVNATEFYEQYRANKDQWDDLFFWLATTDLLNIPAGRHPIEGSTLVASVEDSQNGPLEKRQSESHYHHIDFQYVVKGVERFGIIDHLTSTPKDKWRPDVIHYNYDPEKLITFDSNPDVFFLFFPCDWHIAKINNDTNDQNIRVIVVKMDYVETQD